MGLHEETFNTDLTEAEKKERPLVAFKNPELIDTRYAEDDDFKTTHLKRYITADGVVKFLKENKGYFKQEQGEDVVFDEKGNNEEDPFLLQKLEDLSKYDADIVEYDDTDNPQSFFKLSNTGIVYAIVINRYVLHKLKL